MAAKLANPQERDQTIAEIVAARDRWVPILLAWTTMPPTNVDRGSLDAGLAEAFGKLRLRAGIPFLISNLRSIRSTTGDFAVWMKTPEAIEQAYPAVSALIRIGAPAGAELIAAAGGPMTAMDRRVAIFALSQMKDVPDAKAFFASVMAEASQESRWAQEGLASIGNKP